MSSPISTTAGLRPSMMSMAEFKAWIMFMFAMASTSLRAHLGTLALEILRHLLEYVLEHQIGVELWTLAHGAEGDRLLPTRGHQRIEFSRQGLMTLLGPFAHGDQMLLQSLDGIAERPMLLVVFGTIARRVVAGRMRGGTIRHQFDQGRAGAGARSFRSPLRDRMHGQKIIAVDTDSRNAIARTPRCERALLAAGVALKRGYGPLIVDHIENDRGLVHRGEQQRMVKIRFRTAALPDPTRSQMVLALDGRRHRPTHRLR